MARTVGQLLVPRAVVPAATGGVAVALGAGAATLSFAPVAAVSALIVGYLLLVSPQAGVVVTLLARPLLDLAPAGLSVPGLSKDLDLSAAVALLLAGCGILYVLVNKIQVLRVPLVVPFLFLLAVASASLLASANPGLTLVNLARLLGQLGLFVLVFNSLKRRSHIQLLAVVLAVSAIAPALWGFAQVAMGHASYIRPSLANGITDPRLTSPFGSGLTVGTFLVLPLVLSITLLLESHRVMARLAFASLAAFLLVSIYFSLARSAWLALVLALGILGIVRYRQIALLGPVLLLVALFAAPDILLRVSPLVENPEATTAVGRVARSEGALEVFTHHPILGAGLGVGDLEAGVEASGNATPAHNDYLRVLADTGLLGFAAYLWLLCAAGVEGVRAYRRLHTSSFRAFALAFLAVWAGFMVMRVSGNVFTHQVFQYNFWALAALALALPRVEKGEEAGP